MDVRYTENNLNGRENVTNGKGSNVSGAYRYRPIDNPLEESAIRKLHQDSVLVWQTLMTNTTL